MSDDIDRKDGKTEPRAAGAAGAGEQDSAERFDEDGLPIDRPATLDDVRGTGGSGRAMAIGCTAIVALLVLAFWLVRAGLFG